MNQILTFIPGIPLWVGIFLVVCGGLGSLLIRGRARSLAFLVLAAGVLAFLHPSADNAAASSSALAAPEVTGGVSDARKLAVDASVPADSPVSFTIENISNKTQFDPSVTGLSYAEIEVTLAIGCRSKQPLQFDELQFVFYAGDKSMSAASTVPTNDGRIRTYRTLEGLGHPVFSPEGTFEIAEGRESVFELSSANSNFALLEPGSDRTLVVTLKRQGQLAYGPFTIKLPWPK